MIEVRVCRDSSSPSTCATDDAALHWGADISDPLLATVAVARERGRVEIDKSYTNRRILALDLLTLDFYQPNQLVEVLDLSSSQRGLLNSFSLTISKSQHNLTVRASAEVEVAA